MYGGLLHETCFCCANRPLAIDCYRDREKYGYQTDVALSSKDPVGLRGLQLRLGCILHPNNDIAHLLALPASYVGFTRHHNSSRKAA